MRKSGGLSCPLAYEEAPDRGLTWRGKCCYVGTDELLSGGSAYQNNRENSHILHGKSEVLAKFGYLLRFPEQLVPHVTYLPRNTQPKRQ